MKKFGKIILVFVVSTLTLTNVSVQATSLEEIKNKGELIVGLNAEYPPFEWVQMVDGQAEYLGIDIALGQAIADEIGVELVIDNRAFDALIPALQANRIDIIISGMAHTETREEQVDFSIPYFQAVSQFAVGKDDVANYTSLTDFNGKDIGVLKGSIQEIFVREEMPEANPVSINKNGDLLEMLNGKKVDAIFMADMSLIQYLVRYGDTVALVENLDIENEGIGSSVAIAKGNEELVAVIDQVITDLIESGEMAEIFAEYSELAGQSLELE